MFDLDEMKEAVKTFLIRDLTDKYNGNIEGALKEGAYRLAVLIIDDFDLCDDLIEHYQYELDKVLGGNDENNKNTQC